LLIFRQLLRLVVSPLDQLHILLRRGDALLGSLREGMPHVDVPAELERHHRAVSLAVMPKGDLEDAAADPLEPLGVLRHPAIPHELELAADDPSCLRWECLNIPPRVPQPHDGPHDRRFRLVLFCFLQRCTLPML
jgi:hypothetical protein